jgi:hypothetical protein
VYTSTNFVRIQHILVYTVPVPTIVTVAAVAVFIVVVVLNVAAVMACGGIFATS